MGDRHLNFHEDRDTLHNPVEEAQTHYWRLENTVVVQGQLFEAALFVVPVMLAALAGELSVGALLP